MNNILLNPSESNKLSEDVGSSGKVKGARKASKEVQGAARLSRDSSQMTGTAAKTLHEILNQNQ